MNCTCKRNEGIFFAQRKFTSLLVFFTVLSVHAVSFSVFQDSSLSIEVEAQTTGDIWICKIHDCRPTWNHFLNHHPKWPHMSSPIYVASRERTTVWQICFCLCLQGFNSTALGSDGVHRDKNLRSCHAVITLWFSNLRIRNTQWMLLRIG